MSDMENNQTELQRLIQENENLKQQVRELQLTDEATGLLTERAILLLLEPQVSRCRRYETPLSIVNIVFRYDDTEMTPGEQDNKALSISRILKDQLRWADMIGRTGPTEFLVILPETTRDSALNITDKLAERIGQTDEKYRVQFGVAEWQKGNNAHDLLYYATQALSPSQNVA